MIYMQNYSFLTKKIIFNGWYYELDDQQAVVTTYMYIYISDTVFCALWYFKLIFSFCGFHIFSRENLLPWVIRCKFWFVALTFVSKVMMLHPSQKMWRLVDLGSQSSNITMPSNVIPLSCPPFFYESVISHTINDIDCSQHNNVIRMLLLLYSFSLIYPGLMLYSFWPTR